MMKKLVCLLILLPAMVFADAKWLQKLNPETLYVVTSIDDDCPLTAKGLRKEVENVIVRSRINPSVGGGIIGYPYLNVSIYCVNLQGVSEKVAALLLLDYVQIVKQGPAPNEGVLAYARLGEEPHNAYKLITDEQHLRSAVKESVEDFVADYLRANFDLGSEE